MPRSCDRCGAPLIQIDHYGDRLTGHVLADADGDKIFSTFDTRDLDKSQPDMSCGTHIITGGTGKYAGITGTEPFACNSLPALAGEGGYTSMDIPHNTAWEIKKSTQAE
jgi:hypothetical protein